MPRPKQCRCVAALPGVTCFRPEGISPEETEEACLQLDEMEALRLADMEGLSASDAALFMGVSRHTFGRILARARRIAATVLCRGQALRIEGGPCTLSRPAPLRDPGEPGLLAVSSRGPSPDDAVEPAFGRARAFVLLQLPSRTFSSLEMPEEEAPCAGLRAAELLAAAGVSLVLTETLGPKALTALRAAGIAVRRAGSATAREALEAQILPR